MTQPDFKPVKRVRATKKQWEQLREQKLLGKPCRSCGGKSDTLHHLVGGKDREDVADALVPLCGDGTTGCHGVYTSRHTGVCADGTRRTWREVADRIGWTVTPAETAYMERVKDVWFIDRAYPMIPMGELAAVLMARAA